MKIQTSLFETMAIFNLFNNDNVKIENKKLETAEDIFEAVTEKLEKMRDDDCNKGTFGTLACICGSYGMAGAAMLCGSAAMTCGSGIVKMILPETIYPIAASNLWEAVFVPMKQSVYGTLSAENTAKILEVAENSTAVVIGCGSGVSEDTHKIVETILEKCTKPIILDADGINCISKHIDVLSKRTAPTVLTPHPGEMSRLTGLTVKEIQSDREKIAVDFANRYGCVLVLKGADTVTSDGKNTFINTTGNGCLAKGGSGDVLAGVIGSLVCQGISPLNAAVSGVYLHGLAADDCIEEYSSSCVTARDVIQAIKFLM